MTNIRTIDLCPGDVVEVRVAASEDGPVIDAGNAAEIDVLRRRIVAMQNAHEQAMQHLEGIYRERLRAATELTSAADAVLRDLPSSHDRLWVARNAFREACRRA